MTLATLILDSLYAGLFLIALGWAFDRLQSRRRHAARPRPADPFAELDRWERYSTAGPHFARAGTRSTWVR